MLVHILSWYGLALNTNQALVNLGHLTLKPLRKLDMITQQ